MPLTPLTDIVLRALEVDLRSAGRAKAANLICKALDERAYSIEAVCWTMLAFEGDPSPIAQAFVGRLGEVMEILVEERDAAT